MPPLVPPRRRRLVRRQFPAPTAAQARAWPLIRAQRNVLIAAPTGSGKTLAAFLAAIDALVREGLAHGPAGRDVRRLRVAAEGAVERRPEEPRGAARRHSAASSPRAGCPTSTSARSCAPATRRSTSARACAGVRRTSSSRHPNRCTCCSARNPGGTMLATTRTVIVDEIHALAVEQARQPPRAVAGSGSRRSSDGRSCASACRRRKSRSRRSRASLSAAPSARRRAAPARRRCAPCEIVDTGHMRAARPRARGARRRRSRR